jgi:2-polyprenyl-3-methyl-5-hydroxy-6-metoxy-1,4-benzoquinol methylase
MENKTKEPQYQFMLDGTNNLGPVTMSIRASTMYRIDPKLLVFTLSRYKFVAKMLSGYKRVLEVGCGDGFASRLVHPEVQELHMIDFDPVFVDDANKRTEPGWPITYGVHDILKGPYQQTGLFDAAFSLDVIEHIDPKDENLYLENICASLTDNGVFICGSPSLESQPYASQPSKEGHINCKTGPALKKLLSGYFENTFLFGMNDEVLHTGFSPMCHYLFVLATGKKKRA